MRRLQEFVAYVPVLLLGIALGSTLSNWGYLTDAGGWFALLGHFVVIAMTLVMLYNCGVLALSILVMPLIVLFSMRERDYIALTEVKRGTINPNAILATSLGVARRALMAVAQPLWKALWWCWWFLRGRTAAEEPSRGDG